MAMKRLDVEFEKGGRVHDEQQVAALLAGLDGVTDLLVISHGWNNDTAEARALYDELLGNVDKLLDKRTAPQLAPLAALAGRTFAACQVFWPSKKFTDKELIPGGGAASAKARTAGDAALKIVLGRLAEDPQRLDGKGVEPTRKKLVDTAIKLIGKLDKDERARAEFVGILRTLLEVKHASPDDASDAFFHEKPEALFKRFGKQVAAPGGPGGGGATSANAGGAAGILDVFESARDAARRLANFATYFQMKGRAGDVGSVGVAPMIKRVRARFPAIKVHLVGHSFGGRLVIAAANALDDNTGSVSVSLLQAAFSHNGLSQDFLNGEPGFFRDVIAKKRASGPIIITHTKNDTAVGIAYPLASRLAGQKAASAAALGDANDPFGGMGRNGAQRTKEVAKTDIQLANAGHKYGFATGSVYNLLADEFIADHSDVRKSQVAYAILCAAAAV
jgi:hypothetical protein